MLARKSGGKKLQYFFQGIILLYIFGTIISYQIIST